MTGATAATCYPRRLGKSIRFQIPLQLSWAFSIHKSQGMTLDSICVDFEGTFCEAQVYVALSRCRSLEGLRIENLDPGTISAPSGALDFYMHLKDPDTFPESGSQKWKERERQTPKMKYAQQILQAYIIQMGRDEWDISETLSIKYTRMKAKAQEEGWKCKSCGGGLKCCFTL